LRIFLLVVLVVLVAIFMSPTGSLHSSSYFISPCGEKIQYALVGNIAPRGERVDQLGAARRGLPMRRSPVRRMRHVLNI
jgi:hypothetical protein